MLKGRVVLVIAAVMIVCFALSQYLTAEQGFLSVVANVCWLAFWPLAFFVVAERLVTLISFLACLPAKRRERRILRDLHSS